MTYDSTEARARAQVRVACGRIAGGAAAIVEAHRLGVPEGPHDRPWAPDYHGEAVLVYAESLPDTYQRDIAALFSRSAQTMAAGSIPARLAENWAIVTEYFRHASDAIAEYLTSPSAESRELVEVTSAEIEGRDSPPMVIRFDALARLTTRNGAIRLEQAAVTVREHMKHPLLEVLDSREQHMLKRLAAGAAVVDLAAEMGHSERSIYRALAGLWKKLGVSSREAGVRKALSDGLAD